MSIYPDAAMHKPIDCVRVDGAADEGPCNEKVTELNDISLISKLPL